MRNKRKNQAVQWNPHVAADWKWVPPPSRPSLSELRVVEDVLSEAAYARDSRLLILGSTAEFRDIAFEFGFETTIVEYIDRNFETLGHHCRHPTVEAPDAPYASVARVTSMINEDWREMEFDDHELFDIVLGDLAVNMVPLDQQQGLIERVARSLRPGGTSIQRIWVRHAGQYSPEVTDIKSLVDEHYADPIQKQRNQFYWLALPLISLFHNPEIGGTRFKDIREELKKLFDAKVIDKGLFEAFEAPWKHYLLPNHLPLKKDADRMFDALNLDYEVRYGTEWFREMCPIYILRK